jgi:signal transduction histidine kinase
MASDLARHAADLDASDRARRQLLADVSHELMTPLTAVLGHLETLMMAEVRLDDARRQKYLGIAAREAHRLERLIGDLLDTARLEAGGGELDPEDVRIAELFDRVIAHHEFERITRKIQIDAAVGPGAELVFGDPFRLEQALVNVTANALRHSPDGGRIALAANVSDGLVGITVTDWGEGIAPEHLPLIFDRFYKARAGRADAQREGGSGLGLSIVRAIVTRHGGRVSATSVPGQGTTIRLDLPLGRRVPAAGFAGAERSSAGRSVA